MRGSGTHSAAFHGIAPTARHVNVAEFAIYRIGRCRIVEFAGTGPLELVTQLTT